jgi:ATP-dependent helicase HrpB
VRDAEWLVALDAEERLPAPPSGAGRGSPGARAGARSVAVRLASAIEPEWIVDLFADEIEEAREFFWDEPTERAVVRESLSWRGLVLHGSPPKEATGEEASRLLTERLLNGPESLESRKALDCWLARVRFAASVEPLVVAPDDHAVRAAVEKSCAGRHSLAELGDSSLVDAVRSSLDGRLATAVDRLAPERVVLGGGRSVLVRYEAGRPARIASRLQDFFGMSDGPRIGGGRVPLVLELLAPNGRAVQVTTDLAGFWQRHYPQLRKQLMRRYPKHAWPEDPMTRPAPRAH